MLANSQCLRKSWVVAIGMDAHSRVVESIKLLRIMKYSGEELAALIRMGAAMAAADGTVTKEEGFLGFVELKNFCATPSDETAIVARSQEMDFADAIGILSSMSDEKKKYATGFLAATMAADGEIDNSEVKLWQLICTLGGFPTMNIKEALAYWTSH